MAIQNLVLVPSKYVENSQTIQYTVDMPQETTIVAILDVVSVTNSSSSAAEFSCNLVQSGGSAGNNNIIIDARRIEPGETYLCPELVGQVLSEGDFVSTLSSVASALVLRISGRLITL